MADQEGSARCAAMLCVTTHPWERIKDLLPGREGHVGFGEWKKVHTRFGRWAKAGAWERVFRHLADDADNEWAMIDSTVVRAHQHSAGAAKKRRGGGDRAQQGRADDQDPRQGRRAGQPDGVRALAGAGA